MKCPNCQHEMDSGVLTDQGSSWVGKGIRSAMQQFGAGIVLEEKVHAWRCSNCGKVELTTKGG